MIERAVEAERQHIRRAPFEAVGDVDVLEGGVVIGCSARMDDESAP